MINNNELEEMMANTDFKYFEVLSDNREILGKFKDKIMDISSFHAVQKLINKVSVEEYTDNVLKKVEQNGNVVIEQEIKTGKYKFIRSGVFTSIEEILLQVVDEPSIYVFIDSGNTFDSVCNDFAARNMPFIHIKYSHGNFEYNGRKFNSINSLSNYLMQNFCL